MLSTLFHIPARITLGGASLPVFGWGLLLVVWAVAGVAVLARTARDHGWRTSLETLGVPLAIAAATILWLIRHGELAAAATWLKKLAALTPEAPSVFELQARLSLAENDRPAAVAAARRLVPEESGEPPTEGLARQLFSAATLSNEVQPDSANVNKARTRWQMWNFMVFNILVSQFNVLCKFEIRSTKLETNLKYKV